MFDEKVGNMFSKLDINQMPHSEICLKYLQKEKKKLF